TCNIRFSSMGHDTGERHWSQRGEYCLDCIASREPDLLCLQECHNVQLADFTRRFGNEYDVFYTNSYAGDYFPENAIFYRKKVFRSHGGGGWHLSEKPHVAGTKGWGSECVRLVNWLLLEDADGSLFRLVNTHFDHASQLARDKAAEMINEDVAAWPQDIPHILTGDLNCDANNTAVKALEAAGWKDTMPEDKRLFPTCHDFLGDKWRGPMPDGQSGRMDYIFIRGALEAKATEIICDHSGTMYPSDHYFLAADLQHS
ncbi:MAG: endonuclease/exonuclease/phosphatase family protein, partial [Victivallales bacterium]|nr:endonuclease/exonuclease/phosphatase family protein [Victivallales bacterium]